MTALRRILGLFSIATAAATALLFAGPASPDELMSRHVASNLREAPVDRNLETMVFMFRLADVDERPGFSPADVERSARHRVAAARADLLREVLRFDLDGNLALDPEEIAFAGLEVARMPLGDKPRSAEEQAEILAKAAASLIRLDRDGDGSVSLHEITTAKTLPRVAELTESLAVRLPPMAFVANADGIVAEAEFTAAVAAILGRVDVNGDGDISRREIAGFSP